MIIKFLFTILILLSVSLGLLLNESELLFDQVIKQIEPHLGKNTLQANGTININIFTPSQVSIKKIVFSTPKSVTIIADNLNIDFSVLNQNPGELSIESLGTKAFILKTFEKEKGLTQLLNFDQLNFNEINLNLNELHTPYLPFSRYVTFKNATARSFNYDKMHFNELFLKHQLTKYKGFAADGLNLSSSNPQTTINLKYAFNPERSSQQGVLRLDSQDVSKVIKIYNTSNYQVSIKAKTSLSAHFDIPENKPISTNFKIYSNEIIINSIDIDRILSHYLNSNEIGLTDIAGFLALGPIGLLASKAVKTSGALPGLLNGQTYIKSFKTTGMIKNNVFTLENLTAQTKNNTLQVKGQLDLDEEKKINLLIAPTTETGCVKMVQRIGGTVGDLDIGQLGILKDNIVKPLEGLIQKGKDLISGKCNQFDNIN